METSRSICYVIRKESVQAQFLTSIFRCVACDCPFEDFDGGDGDDETDAVYSGLVLDSEQEFEYSSEDSSKNDNLKKQELRSHIFSLMEAWTPTAT